MFASILQDYLIFLAKAVTVVVAIGAVVVFVASAVRQLGMLRGQDRLDVNNLNDRFRDLADAVRETLLPDSERKKLAKKRRAEEKARQKGEPDQPRKPHVFVLDFDGDLHAHAVVALREEISTVLQIAEAGDEVLLRLESEGGLVHAYGLAASQLARLRARNIALTVAVDKVAASGGYLMACVANRIIGAPFAILGSIGVIGQLPNFNRLLKRMDIDYEMHTAGEFKRTLTMFGENSDAARGKFREELEDTHGLFKAFVAEHRPQLDLDKVATGEHWFGSRALELQLIDAVQTSDDYLLEKADTADLLELKFHRRKPLSERLSDSFARFSRGVRRGLQDNVSTRWR